MTNEDLRNKLKELASDLGNIEDAMRRANVRTMIMLEHSEAELAVLFPMVKGEEYPLDCKICKVPTPHRYDGVMYDPKDLLSHPQLHKYLDHHQVTCQECHGSFYYDNGELVIKIGAENNE